MVLTQRSNILILAIVCAAFAGCPATTSNSVVNSQTRLMADSAQPNPSEVSRPQFRSSAALRESPLSHYHNAEYGFALRFPRNYILEEGNIQEHSYFLKRQEQLDLEQPGARLLATLLIPEDGYPNTNFLHGSLQLIVDENQAPEICRQVPSADGLRGSAIRGLATQGLQLGGAQTQSTVAGTQIVERDYAAWANGACLKFSLVVAVDDLTGDSDLKPADPVKIMHQLERIVSSLQTSQDRFSILRPMR